MKIHTGECQMAMYRGPQVCICGAADRPTTEPRTEDVDADECGHMTLTRWTGGPGVDDIWACSDCSRRFYPACPQCVTVGHRDGHRAGAASPAALDVRRAVEEISGELSHYDLSDDPGYIKVPTERVRAILLARLSPSEGSGE